MFNNNNYNQYGYGNYGYNNYYYPNQQQVAQPQMQQQIQHPNYLPLTYVNGEEGAKAYIVSPNTTIYLRDSDSNKLFIKTSDNCCSIILCGHTHGGQVSLFGLYTPVKNSSYGTRFLRGRNRTSSGATIITTNGVGTSRRKVRFCVPSELVYITLKRK